MLHSVARYGDEWRATCRPVDELGQPASRCSAAGRGTWSNNSFSDSDIGDKTRRIGKPKAATGIVLEATTDIVISGNIFSGLAGAAVTADEKCRRVAILGNVMTELNRANTERRPDLDLHGAAAGLTEHNLPDDSPPAPVQ